MTIQDLAAFGADINTGLQRCMNNETFYLRLVKMVPNEPGFPKLYEAMDARDLDAAFSAAHALKGSVSNLALTPLSAPLVELTELLRARSDTDYTALMETIRAAHERLRDLCAN